MSHLDKLKAAMVGKADAILITSEINQRYLTGFAFTDGYVLVTAEKSYLITDFRYVEAATAEAGKEFEVTAPTVGMKTFIRGILSDGGINSLMYEDGTLSCLAYSDLCGKLDGITLIAGGTALVDGLREFKDDGEIRLMAKAQDIADAAFAHILSFIKPGMTEIEVALELEFYMRKNGAEGTAFDTIAVSGSASSLPHGVPRNIPLERGFFTMDFGAKYKGYCSDMTRTVVIGKADAEMKRLYSTVLTAHIKALEAISAGAGCRATDTIARDIINGAGYQGCFGHSLGHGVGMYIHEQPRLSPGAPVDAKLRPGHVVTDEPGIYITGKYGCRIEDMIAVTDKGILDFAHSPKELIELF